MNRRQIKNIFAASLFFSGVVSGSSAALAQNFQSYRCADGTRFIAGFYQYDSRAHLQIDGRPVTLARRFGLSGSYYSGGGIRLKITGAGAEVRHLKRPATVCEPA
jgi:membrane-bound inhibitor of C-type lysozyme